MKTLFNINNLATIALFLAAPALGQGEVVPDDEAVLTQNIAAMIADSVRAEYEANGFALRDAHAKAHGCVRGELAVNAQLPADLKNVGVFQEGKTYPTWIRYSNGSGRSANDADGDGRGMAIKLLNVDGEKLLDDERDATTQDFLMINHPVFFVRNASDYVEFTEATNRDGNPLKFFFPGLNPFNWRTHELGIVREIQAKKVANPLTTAYWTMTPLKYGDQAVKMAAIPCQWTEEPSSVPDRPNYLREAMVATLASGGACFDLVVQSRTDPETMPVEDPTIEWSESDSPYRKVATLTIGAQRFDSEEQQAFCEHLSYTPWHSLPAHRPLGGINRVRKDVYQTISRVRHELNGSRREEPTGEERFPQ